MSTQMDVIENKLKERSALVINNLISKLGIEVDIIKFVQNDVADVYGINADKTPKGGTVINKNVLFTSTGDQFMAVDAFSISTIQEAFLYDPDGDVAVGDLVEVKREGNLIRQFHVKEKDAMGQTNTVIDRFLVIPTGE